MELERTSMAESDSITPESEALVPLSDSMVSEDFVHVDNPSVREVSGDETEELASSGLSENPNQFFEDVVGSSVDIPEDESAVSGIEGFGGAAQVDVDREGHLELPEELSKGVVVLECDSSAEGGSCRVFLVGTAHVSQESCREVEAVIGYLKPQVVFLELCAGRVGILTPQNVQVPTMREMIDMWKKKNMNTFGVLYSWFLAKVASRLEVFPGAEFRVAYEEAKKYGGKVILGDRPVQITLRRTWGKMSLWHKVKLIYSLVFQAVFLPSPEELTKMLKNMDDGDMITLVIQEMSKTFPTLMETIVHERDMYMSSTLLRTASTHSSVVAVVGKGHLRGITKNWNQPLELEHLMEIPTSNTGAYVARIFRLSAAVAGIAVVSSIYLACRK